MDWPGWIKDRTWQWVIGTAIAIAAIAISLIFSGSQPDQNIEITGGQVNVIQIKDSPGAEVDITIIDTKALAKELAKELRPGLSQTEKDEEIKVLEATIERLKKDPGDELRSQALLALQEYNPVKATELLEKAAKSRTTKAAQLNKEAALDWIDVGNIAYLNDTQRALKAYQEAARLDDTNPVVWNRLGFVLIRLGRLDESESAYEKVLSLAGDDEALKAVAFGNRGIIYRIRGDLARAEEYYLKALEIYKALGRREGMADQYGNLGNIYLIRGDLVKAEAYHLKSLEIEKALGRMEGMADQYGSLGNIYKDRRDLAKAEKYYLESLLIYKMLGHQEGVAKIYGNLGNIYETRRDLAKAEEYYLKSLEINIALGRQEGMAKQYGNLGNINGIRGDLAKSEEYLLKSLEINLNVA